MCESGGSDPTAAKRRPSPHDRLPVLPPGAPLLVQALSDDDLDFVAVARAVEKVPSVAARLLALANSAWSAPISPISSIEAACSRLGLQVVRSAGVALAVAQPFNPSRCPPFDGCLYWGTALLGADAAARLAEQALPNEAATARTAALLANLGLLWLADSLPDETAIALSHADDAPPGGLNRLLQQHCGLGFDSAGGLLAEAWDFPTALVEAIAQHYSPPPDAARLTQVVAGAVRLVGSVRRDLELEPSDHALTALGIDAATQQRLVEELGELYRRNMEMAEALFPSC